MVVYIVTHLTKAKIDVCIGVTQNDDTQFIQVSTPLEILLLMDSFVVLGTIQFNDDSGRGNIEINDIVTNHFLSMNCDRQQF